MRRYEDTILFGLVDFPSKPWLHIILLAVIGGLVTLIPAIIELHNMPVVNDETLKEAFIPINPNFFLPFQFLCIIIFNKKVFRDIAGIVREVNKKMGITATDEEVYDDVIKFKRKPSIMLHQILMIVSIFMCSHIILAMELIAIVQIMRT